MASFTGYAIQPIFGATDYKLSNNFESFTGTWMASYGVDIASFMLGNGAITNNLPISLTHTARSGLHVHSYFDDFYERIHISMTSYAIGLISQDLEVEFSIWNAHTDNKTMASIDETETDGLTLDVIPPRVFGGLEEKTITLEVDGSGAVQFTGIFKFNFTGTNSVELTVTGIRVIVLGWMPEKPFRETYEWLTNIIVPKEGIASEQRVALRSKPRRLVTYDVVMPTRIRQQTFDTATYRQAKRAWGIPIWSNVLVNRNSITAGDSVISMDLTDTEITAGSFAMIWQTTSKYEIVLVKSLTSTALTLSTVVSQDFSGPQAIIPVVVAYADNAIRVRDLAYNMSQVQMSFKIADLIELTSYSADLTYKGQPVLTYPSEMTQSGSDHSFDGSANFYDPEVGLFQPIFQGDETYIGRTYGINCRTLSECTNFKRLLYYLMGRCRTLWLPTFNNDLVPIADVDPASGVINVKNIQYYSQGYGPTDELINHLIFVFNDGTRLCREITGITDNGDGTERIDLDTPLGKLLTPTNCKISFLHCCRLANDQVDLEWYDVNHLRATLDLTVVKNELS